MHTTLADYFSVWPSLALGFVLLLVLAGCAGFRARDAEAAYPATGKFVRVGGYRVHYVCRGAGPVAVYVHGSQGSTADLTLSPTYEALAGRFTVIAYDRPGFGHTKRDDRRELGLAEQAAFLQRFIEAMDLAEKPIVVGHSLGGSIALQHAADFPGAARGYVVISAVAYGWGGGATLLESIARVPVVGDLVVAALIVPVGPGAAKRALAEAFSPGEAPAKFAAIATDFALRPSQYRATAMDMPSLSGALDALSPRYGGIAAPLAIVHGGRDTICPATYHATRLHEAVRGSRLILLPEAPHELQFTDAEAILDAVLGVSGNGEGLTAEAQRHRGMQKRGEEFFTEGAEGAEGAE